MLSRIAESLFWMGRYLERADATARLLDAQLHQVLEDPLSDEDEIARVLLSVMGLPVPLLPLSLQEATAALAFDRTQPSSIVSSLAAARENARGAREMIASELWECLNGAHAGLLQRRMEAQTIGPHAFFGFSRFVRDRVALADGIADATMSRDHSWRFLVLGRNLERVDMTARLLAVRASLARSASDWVTTLRCCSAHESYLRTNRSIVDGPRVLRYLLLDPLSPRSVRSALAAAEACCVALDADHGHLGSTDRALAALRPAAEELDDPRFDALLARLPELLAALGETCATVSRSVTSRYFRDDQLNDWRWRSGLGGAAVS